MNQNAQILLAMRFTRFVLPPILAISYFFRNVYGFFILSVTLYLYLLFWGETKPLSFSDLLLWTDSLPASDKLGLLQSVITVCGFLFAFHSASKNWKDQELGKLRIQAANDLDDLCSSAGKHAVDVGIIARYTVEFVDTFRASGANSETAFQYVHLVGQLPKLSTAVSELDQLSAMSHRLGGRHHLVLAGIPFAKKSFDSGVDSLSQLCDAHYFYIPKLIDTSEMSIASFCSKIQYEKCKRYLEIYEEHYSLMNGYFGGCRGALLSQITGLSLRTILSLDNWDEVEKQFTRARAPK